MLAPIKESALRGEPTELADDTALVSPSGDETSPQIRVDRLNYVVSSRPLTTVET